MVLKANGGAAYVDGASAHARLVLKENGGAAYFVGASIHAWPLKQMVAPHTSMASPQRAGRWSPWTPEKGR